jgi:predicted metal-binding protein
LLQNLERYKEEAIRLGASRSRVVKVEEIPVDERVVRKCQIPLCPSYGVSINCPPNTVKPEELKTLLKKYNWAVFFIKELPTELLLKDVTDKERKAAFQNIFRIVQALESTAFYDGHYLATGFGAGSCRRTFCGKHETCAVIEGKGCRFPLLARPSMEAVGIDVYKMAASAKWDVHPIGRRAKPEHAPGAILSGIVIV